MNCLYGCLLVPDFAVAVLVRGERGVTPTAVVSGNSSNQFVYAANLLARQAGVREGMPLAEAKARYHYAESRELRVFTPDPEAEKQVQRELLDLARTVSPRLEDAAPGLIMLDLAGLPDPHSAATQLSYGAEKLGLHANVGVSRNRFVALCVARTQTGVTHIFPGEEAGFLKAQRLEALPLEEKECETLARWGIATVGELAELPEDGFVERFGERGARLVRLAQGEDDSLLRADELPPQFEEKEDLDWQIGELEPLSFLLSRLLENLCLRLQSHNLAVMQLFLTLKLTNGSRFERTLQLAYPLADPHTLLTLVRLDLAGHPPGDAVEGVAVSAQPTQRRLAQFSLFAPALPSPEKLAVTLGRLTNLVGRERVGAPIVPDTHRPGAQAVSVFAPSSMLEKASGAVTADCCLPLPRGAAVVARQKLVFRCFRPPRPARVVLHGAIPAYVDAEIIAGKISTRAGPWRVYGEWWTEEGWQYEEWDVEVQGKLYRICCERQIGEWHVTGAYD